MTPVAIPPMHGSRFLGGCCGYVWFCPVGGTHQARRPGRERPPKPRAWYGREALRVFTRCPRPPGVAPVQISLAGRLSSAAAKAADLN